MLYIWEERRGIRKEAQGNWGELSEHWHSSKSLLPTHAETCWACKESSWVGRMEWRFYSIGQLRQRWRALSYWSLTNRWIRANSCPASVQPVTGHASLLPTQGSSPLRTLFPTPRSPAGAPLVIAGEQPGKGRSRLALWNRDGLRLCKRRTILVRRMRILSAF